jgi:hypothetical protein
MHAPLFQDGLFSVPASLGNLWDIQRGFFMRSTRLAGNVSDRSPNG